MRRLWRGLTLNKRLSTKSNPPSFAYHNSHTLFQQTPKQKLSTSVSPMAPIDSMQPSLAYWNFIPENERTEECPTYLRNLSDKDQAILGSWDADFKTMPWAGENGVRDLVLTNRLERFKRLPSQLRGYRKYIYDITLAHGSVMDFILEHRLCWSKHEVDALLPATSPSSTVTSSASSVASFATSFTDPFERPSDWKILRNDWPYGIDQKVVHLVVWTKFDLTEDPDTGDLTTEMRRTIEGFVERTFKQKMGDENVVWFKNWKSLKSVPAIEHFHVMIFNPDPSWIEQLTGEKSVYREEL